MAKRSRNDFQDSMVRLVIDGEMTSAQMCQEHPLAKSVLSIWLQQWRQQFLEADLALSLSVGPAPGQAHPSPIARRTLASPVDLSPVGTASSYDSNAASRSSRDHCTSLRTT